MSILEELKKYAHECINDVIVSSKKHKWACERFLKDLENPKFYWDEEEAQRIYKWFTYLRHSKGELAKATDYFNHVAKVCDVSNTRLEKTRGRFEKI